MSEHDPNDMKSLLHKAIKHLARESFVSFFKEKSILMKSVHEIHTRPPANSW